MLEPHPHVRRTASREYATTLAAIAIALAWAALAAAQDRSPSKKDEGAIVLFLLPLGIFFIASLQIALLGAFPRFARRCATAVNRYRWQTPLAGLAAFLAVGVLAGLASAASGGNERAGLPFVLLGALVAMVGGVGVSLLAGRWALERINPGDSAHPVLEVLAGASLIGWAALLVPCAGQVLWGVASCAAMGAFFVALFGGRRLDEAPNRRTTPPAAAPTLPAERPKPGSNEDSQMF